MTKKAKPLKKLTELPREDVKRVVLDVSPEDMDEYIDKGTQQKLAEQEATIDQLKYLVQQRDQELQEAKGGYEVEQEKRLDEVIRRQRLEKQIVAESSIFFKLVNPVDYGPVEVRTLSYDNLAYKDESGKVCPFLWGVRLQRKHGGYTSHLLLTDKFKSHKPTSEVSTNFNLSELSDDFINQISSGILRINQYRNETPLIPGENIERRHMQLKGENLLLRKELSEKQKEIQSYKDYIKHISIAEEESRNEAEMMRDISEINEKANISAEVRAKAATDRLNQLFDDHTQMMSTIHDTTMNAAFLKRELESVGSYVEDLETYVAEKRPESEIERIEGRTEERVYRGIETGRVMALSKVPQGIGKTMKDESEGTG